MTEKNLIYIKDFDNPELQPYLTLRRSEEQRKKGIFIAEGGKVVLRLLNSSLKIHTMLTTEEWFNLIINRKNENSPVKYDDRLNDCKIFIASKAMMEKIVGYRLHQGIIAVASIPEEPKLEEFLTGIKTESIIVALDNLVNSENVGVIVRNCAAFGVDLILAGETSSSPYLRRAVRNSMGAVFHMPVIHTKSLFDSLNLIRDKFYTRIIATDPHDNSSIFDTDLRGNICIVFGNEDSGVSEQIMNICDEKISIPMMNNTDSLNVASASSVFLYEARKQRFTHGKR